MLHQEYMGLPSLIKHITDMSEALFRLMRNMKMKIAISSIAILTLSTNVFASSDVAVVILECGEYNFSPGINILQGNSSVRKPLPPYLSAGSNCAVAIANLSNIGFKIQDSGVSAAQLFKASNVIHSYTLTTN